MEIEKNLKGKRKSNKMKKKGFNVVTIWVGKNNSSIEFAGYKGRMIFSLSRQGNNSLYEFLQNIDFGYIELYHHRTLKATAEWTSEKQRANFENFLCRFYSL